VRRNSLLRRVSLGVNAEDRRMNANSPANSSEIRKEENALLASLEKQAHAWVATADALPCAQLRQRYETLLSAGERDRFERFASDHVRNDYLAAHALLRLSLSRYAGVDPAAWVFGAGLHGKPFLRSGPSLLPLCFSLSHTRGLVACVVTLDCACGIDVELVKPSRNFRAIAGEVFTDAEIADLDRRAGNDAADRFFQIWTLKEAYIKATGEGFSADLKRIGFDGTEGPAPVLRRDSTASADREWTFLSRSPTAQHKLAVAVRACREIVYADVTL
jgi:4'-phosphopantetheinyl transferase